MAHVQNLARLTVAGQGIQFRLPERPLRSTFQKVNQWSLLNIPQPMLRVDEVVARKEVSVMFNHGNISAGLPKDTERMFLPESSPGCLFEYLHFDPLDIVLLPLVKDGAEKIAQGLRRHRARAHPALSAWLRLDQGQKANVGSLDLLEEPVDLTGVLDVFCMHHTQDIAKDPVLSQEPVPAHRFLVGGVLALEDAVSIMHSLRTIQAKAYRKALLRQETAPVLVEESAIGLYPVGDALVTGLVLVLQRHNLAKVVQAQEERLPAMPGKVDHRTGGGGNMLDDVFLQYGVGHAKRLIFWIEVFLLQVIAIVTVQVADGAKGLDEDLKFAGSLNHCSIPHLWSDYKWDNPCGSNSLGFFTVTDTGTDTLGRPVFARIGVALQRAGTRMVLMKEEGGW